MPRWTVALALLVTGCPQNSYTFRPASPAAVTAPAAFRAAMGKVDLTPPPGPPLGGYGPDSAAKNKGYQSRIHARVLLLEDTDGDRLALVQTDIALGSALLHRMVSDHDEVIAAGLRHDRILLTASHTHASLGNLQSARYFNELGANTEGVDPDFVAGLADRIGQHIAGLAADLAPAKVGAIDIDVPGVSYNQSLEAWEENLDPKQPIDRADAIVARVRVLRVDRIDGVDTTPIGAFGIAPLHPTAVGHDNELVSPDIHGAAARALERAIGVDGFVASFSNGAEGDQNPLLHLEQSGFLQAERVGTAIATEVANNWNVPLTDQVDLQHGYVEAAIAGASAGNHTVCERAVVGVAVLGGGEGGRSGVYGLFDVFEGSRKKGKRLKDCQGAKLAAAGLFQRVLIADDDVPHMAPFQVLRIGDVLTLATIPGEPTAWLGQAIESDVAAILPGSGPVATVGLANEYIGYFTTAKEYRVQHYEGASTLYGQWQSRFARDRLELAAKQIADGTDPVLEKEVLFRPGRKRSFCGDDPWRDDEWEVSGPVESCRPASAADRRVPHRIAGKQLWFEWRGLHKRASCTPPPPTVQILCGGQPATSPDGIVQDDDAASMLVSRKGADKWTARWTIPPGMAAGSCQFQIRTSRKTLTSSTFDPQVELARICGD